MMITRVTVLAGVLLVWVASAAPTAWGQVIPVTTASFGPNTVTETFEGQLNVTVPQDFIPFDGGTMPFGTLPLDHTFATGVTLSGQSSAPDTVLFYDWSVGFIYNVTWNLGTGGLLHWMTPGASGVSYLANKDDLNGGAMEFTFPAPVHRVGAFVEVLNNAAAVLSVYDAGNSLLGSHQVTTDGVTSNGIDTFIGVHSDTPIAKATLLLTHGVVDDVMFDNDLLPILNYGVGCPGTGGFVPELTATGNPQAGAILAVAINGGLGGATSFMFLGDNPASIPVGKCSLLITPINGIVAIPLGGTGPGAGAIAFNSTVPPAAPVGASGTVQVWVADPSVGIGAAASNGLRITVVP